MKNILRNLIILSAVLLFASCEKQPVGGNDPDNGTTQTLELMISLPEKIEGAATLSSGGLRDGGTVRIIPNGSAG